MDQLHLPATRSIISHVNLPSRLKNVLGLGVRNSMLWGGRGRKDAGRCTRLIPKELEVVCKDTHSEEIRTEERRVGKGCCSQGWGEQTTRKPWGPEPPPTAGTHEGLHCLWDKSQTICPKRLWFLAMRPREVSPVWWHAGDSVWQVKRYPQQFHSSFLGLSPGLTEHHTAVQILLTVLDPKIKCRTARRMHCLLTFTTKFPVNIRQQASFFKIGNQVRSYQYILGVRGLSS